MLAAGSRDRMPGGNRMEIWVECCRPSMLEIGTRFSNQTLFDRLGEIQRVSWIVPVCVAQTLT